MTVKCLLPRTFSSITSLIWALSILSLILSCTDSNGRKGRPLIKDFTIVTEERPGCGPDHYLILLEQNQCVVQCPEETMVGNQEQLDEIYAESKLDDDSIAQFTEIINDSKGACIPEVIPVVRPNKQVYIRNYCACEKKKAIILNACDAECAGRASNEPPTLFGSVDVGPDIKLNDELRTLSGWCNNQIDDGGVSPACYLELYSEQGTDLLSVNVPANSNIFNTNISSLPFDVTFSAKLVVMYGQDTWAAESTSFQIRKILPKEPDNNPKGPLKIANVTQYSCLQRIRAPGLDYYYGAGRQHFYFVPESSPPPQEPGNRITVCHDTNTYGLDDSPLYPRLEQITPIVKIWDQSDRRFVSNMPDGAGRPNINLILEQRLFDDYQVSKTLNIFNLLQWPTSPQTASSSSLPNLGFFMIYWVDVDSNRAFCPKQSHYYGNIPEFKLLKEYVGVDTEAFYAAEKEIEIIFTDPTNGQIHRSPQDVIFIRESELKKVWFYIENGLHMTPNDITVSQKTIHFYYPIKPNGDPHVKQSDQKIYTVKHPGDLGVGTPRTGLQTTIAAHDKRFGCIPILD